ncbi:hypothetical protein O6H91_20G025200 [Diphasiastrum complanatum]|uniref:Uncharacterized protein n=2 Tax=Diphasiastrum complanatum TaxID=34168 RepID=A0ACC2ANN4_DIPCM|nr:hypothetical protein O6H91_20G025200 [Diphasiastrum complanatum]KAJ7519154.1 hypothetical protein O6H91_20G025200 [Diphasiastrum complanatum]
MRTRRASYPSVIEGMQPRLRKSTLKRINQNLKSTVAERPCVDASRSVTKKSSVCKIDALPDDLLVAIIVGVSSTASSPADLINTMLTCRRFCAAARHPVVLANVVIPGLAVKADSWSDGAHRFLKQCAVAGNVEACYTLGMIQFFCLNNRVGGASLMARAAMASHASALHSLAVIQLNGSGGTRKDKDLKAAVALCARAASLGHVDAIRELGHCFLDGYGVTKNFLEGRRLLLEANAREVAAVLAVSPRSFIQAAMDMTVKCEAVRCPHQDQGVFNKADSIETSSLTRASFSVGGHVGRHPILCLLEGGGCSLLSDFGCNVPPSKIHVANKFMVDWFSQHPPAPGLRLCSHANCGRCETRRHEFRRCSACGSVNYCSRACQALDWKFRHQYDCIPAAIWDNRG